jgi:hypothetical protein
MSTQFSPSQLSYADTISPFTFRLSPLRLLRFDICLIIQCAPFALGVLSPFLTRDPMGELYLGRRGNVISLVLNVILFLITQIGFAGVVFLFVTFTPVAGVLVFVALCISIGFPGKTSRVYC